MRVVRPTVLDFAGLVDGLRRNNVGFGGAEVTADVKDVNGHVRFEATGQSFPRAGPSPGPGSSRRTLRVLDAKDPSRTRLEILR